MLPLKSRPGVPRSLPLLSAPLSLLLLLLFLQLSSVRAQLEEEISFGGGDELVEPELRLSRGDGYPLHLNEGDRLDVDCLLGPDVDPSQFQLRWKRIDRDGRSEILSPTAQLYLPQTRADDFRGAIVCEATRLEDGETFLKQLNVNLQVLRQPTTLDIIPLPEEDQISGRIARECIIKPDPLPNQQWEFFWADSSGRLVARHNKLRVHVRSRNDLGKYTCHARNLRTNDVLLGEFTIHAIHTPDASPSTYNTEIEPITPQLVYGRPYEARCVVRPTPSEPIRFTWYYKGREVSQSERVYISQFTRETAGQYICQAQSLAQPYGTPSSMYANATLGLRLKASSEEHIELGPPPGPTLVTYLGETRELHCEIGHEQQLGTVRWFFNGTEITPGCVANSTGRIHRVDFMRVSILTLNGVEEFHEGNYECRTDDDIKSVDVIVISDFDVEVNPPLYEVDEGEHVEIHCSVQGGRMVPNTELRWFFEPKGTTRRIPMDFNTRGGFIRTDDPRAQRTSVIAKQHAVLADEGRYICIEPRGQEGVSVLIINKVDAGSLRISPEQVRVRPGQTVIVNCFSTGRDGAPTGPSPRFRAFDPRIRISESSAGEYATRGSITGFDASLNGTIIECYSDDPRVKPETAVIYVEDVCPPGHRRCRNGECLEAGRFCDGNRDCADGSDEDPSLCEACDPIARRCEPFGGAQPDKKTFMVHWQCDGEDDCGNGFDETGCSDPSIASCTPQTFQCPGGGFSIPRSFVCDKQPDCDRGEDEDSCIEPQIVNSPMEQYTHRRGDRVVLTCEVAGQPSPRVIWRFNWGCLGDEGGRMRVENRVVGCGGAGQKVVSTLTINNFMPGDDGIYNCEGLNGMKRAMSDDYVVILRG